MSFAEIFLFIVRVLLAFLSLYALSRLALPLGYIARGSASIFEQPLWVAFPLIGMTVYLVYCLVCCFGVLRGRVLIITGIAMNTIQVITAFLVYFHGNGLFIHLGDIFASVVDPLFHSGCCAKKQTWVRRRLPSIYDRYEFC